MNNNSKKELIKKISLLLALLIAVLTISAQKADSLKLFKQEVANRMTDKSEYLGYTISLIPGSIGKYGFDILNVNRSELRHFQNPLAFSQRGIQKKEDAYKIAQWIIAQYKRTGHWVNLVPPHIVNELKMNSN